MQPGFKSEPTHEPTGHTSRRSPLDPVSDSQKQFLTLLFNRYRGSIQKYVARRVRSLEDASDIVQESYYRVLRHSQLSEFENIARSYLFQTATNLIRDYYRRRTTRAADAHMEIDEAMTLGIDAPLQEPLQELISQETLGYIKRSVRELPPELRAVFLLSRVRKLTYQEIGTELRISTRTVERRMATAMDRLATQLERASGR